MNVLSVIAIICSVFINTIIGAQVQTRSDYVATLILGQDYETLQWDNNAFCDPGYFVRAIGLNVDIGGGDEQGANSMWLYCDNEVITSSSWAKSIDSDNDGSWSNVGCGGIYPHSDKINGYQVRQGDSSVGIVSVKGHCTDGNIIEPANGATQWARIDDDARFTGWSFCPTDSAVCGYAQKIDSLTIFDDSGLNSIALHCCRLPISYTELSGEWRRLETVGGQGGVITHEISFGTTHTDQYANTVENLHQLTKSLSAGLEFKGISVGGSLSTVDSTKITNEHLVSSITTTMNTDTITCKEGAEGLFQFIVTGNYYYGYFPKRIKKTVTIVSKSHWCSSNQANIPKCPPTLCKRDLMNSSNDDCQECLPGVCNWQCYLNRYSDLKAVYGNNEILAAQHWDIAGKMEGRNCRC